MDEDNAFTEARNFYSKQNASSLVFSIKLLFLCTLILWHSDTHRRPLYKVRTYLHEGSYRGILISSGSIPQHEHYSLWLPTTRRRGGAWGLLSNTNNMLQYAFSMCIFNIPNFLSGSFHYSEHPQACLQCLTPTTCFNMLCTIISLSRGAIMSL